MVGITNYIYTYTWLFSQGIKDESDWEDTDVTVLGV